MGSYNEKDPISLQKADVFDIFLFFNASFLASSDGEYI